MKPWPYSGDDEAGSWWDPASPDEIRAEQARVAAARSAVNVGLQAKPPADSAESRAALASWAVLDAKLATYLSEQSSALWWTRDDQVKQGQDFEAQIEGWRAKFSALGAGVPSAPIAAVAPNSPAGVLTSVTVILAMLAGVYVVSKTGLPEIWPRKTRKR